MLLQLLCETGVLRAANVRAHVHRDDRSAALRYAEPNSIRFHRTSLWTWAVGSSGLERHLGIPVLTDALEDHVSESREILRPSAKIASHVFAAFKARGTSAEMNERLLHPGAAHTLCAISRDNSPRAAPVLDFNPNLSVCVCVGIVGVRYCFNEGPDDVATHGFGGVLVKCTPAIVDLATFLFHSRTPSTQVSCASTNSSRTLKTSLFPPAYAPLLSTSRRSLQILGSLSGEPRRSSATRHFSSGKTPAVCHCRNSALRSTSARWRALGRCLGS